MAETNENMNVFTSKIINLPDLAKQYLYQTKFTPTNGGNSVLNNIFESEDLMIRAKTISMPSKSFNELTTSYLGSEIKYPGKPTIAGTFSIQFDEFQDLYISNCFYQWQNIMYNQDFTINTSNQYTGGAISNRLSDYTCNVDVILYDSTLKTKLPYFYRYYLVWPKEISQAELSQEGDQKITRQITFQYSTFEMLSN